MKYSNQPIWALATFLTLLLAGCGGSSSTSGTPEMTELQKAQKAAMDASDMAKTKSDEAKTSADGAQEAVMGLAEIQTGNPMAKTHAEAARKAADEALAAYNLAKKEYDKTRAAGSRTAAVEARIAAEAARMKADTQAKMAADEAMKAQQAASREVRHVEGMTYKVGDTSITAGAPKATKTIDGKTVTTGTIRDTLYGYWSWRLQVNYAAASGNKPETRAQPRIVDRTDLPLRFVTDSEDDLKRLTLVYQYATSKNNKMVSLFRDRGTNKPDTTVSEANPYGTVTVGGKAVPIMRAQGEFYISSVWVSGTTYRLDTRTAAFTPKSNTGDGAIQSVRIAADSKDANAATGLSGIYYYMDGSTKKWLRLSKSATDTAGAVTLTYDDITVYENVRFPTVMPFKHMNFGLWASTRQPPGDETGDTLFIADMGIGFVKALPDSKMSGADMPNFGSAKYEGYWISNQRQADAGGEGEISGWLSGAETTADFGKNTIKVDLKFLATLEGRIDGDGFSGTKVTAITAPASNNRLTKDASKFTGTFSGNFFGPMAAEVGGVFDFTSEGKKAGEFRGSFGGVMVE